MFRNKRIGVRFTGILYHRRRPRMFMVTMGEAGVRLMGLGFGKEVMGETLPSR